MIGEIFTKFFPEIECFRPQLNHAADEREFRMFSEFLKKISKYKPVQTAWSQMIERKQSALQSSEEEQRSDV